MPNQPQQGQQPGQGQQTQGQGGVQQLLQQSKQQAGNAGDPTQTLQPANTFMPLRLQHSASNPQQVQQLAQELQQNAQKIAEACCE